MSNGLNDIIGRQIAAVVVAESDRGPKQQVFFVFADGTHFEFRGVGFSCSTGFGLADGIEPYVEARAGRIVRFYGDVRAMAPISLARALAKAAIAKAMGG